MIAIAIVDENWGIGVNDDQPYYIPMDLKYFKARTRNKTVVMGRTTLEALSGSTPLPNRENIILTRQANYSVPGATVCNSFEELAQLTKKHPTNEVFIIGGAQIYEAMLPYCSEALVTKVFADGRCDKFFKNLDQAQGWEQISESTMHQHEGIDFKFCVYKNKEVINFYGN